MRLDDFDPNINVRDDGEGSGGGGLGFGGGGGGGAMGGLLFGLLPLIGSRFGCGGIAVVLILFAVFGGLGNISGLLGGGGSSAPTSQSAPAAGQSAVTICKASPERMAACNAFSSTDKTWAAIFAKQGQQFVEPTLHFYKGGDQSGCGAAQSAMGPFYCPQDQGIYLDTSFFDELANRFQATGDFARDYVIAHEFGHHIQKLLGVSDKVSAQEASSDKTQGNALSVRLELQADCYAGVWAAANRDRMDPGDVQSGLTAAHAIGDDTLQKQAQGQVVPDSFTHGSSAERMKWLKRGLDTGDPAQCDTFSGSIDA